MCVREKKKCDGAKRSLAWMESVNRFRVLVEDVHLISVQSLDTVIIPRHWHATTVELSERGEHLGYDQAKKIFLNPLTLTYRQEIKECLKQKHHVR